MLEQYNRAFPGAAERIMGMAEAQMNHRHGLENRALNAKILGERVGQGMAFVLATMGILGALWLMSNGLWQSGFGVLLTTLGSIVTAFIVGRWQQKSELKKKAEPFVQG